MKVIAASAGLSAFLPELLRAKKLALSLDKAEKLKEVGGAELLRIKDQDILFIRESQDVIRAIDPECRHKKCTVEYNSEEKLIICPCHGSTYSTDGKVLKGPSTKDLGTFEATISEGRIILSLDEK